MRAAIVALLVLLLTAAVGSRIGSASTGHGGCAVARAGSSVQLPAAVTVRTACGAFRIGRDGSVLRKSADPAPVPQGAGWWPYTGVWDKLVGGHLVVGRWQKRLWRSRGRFPVAYEVGAIVVAPHALAFSYGNRAPRLYVAAFAGSERRIASGEYPLGWTRDGLYTRAARGGELLLRSASGALRETLARQVFSYVYDDESGSLYFVEHGALVRADSSAQHAIASLRRLGLAAGRSLQLQPLGRLVALEDSRRLVVLRADGSPFASMRLPSGRTRVDGISSRLAVAPAAQGVAFTATRGNTASGSTGSETVYLLRPGSSRAQPIHSERVGFAVCERGADLAWHGRWLLYSASEGNTAIIDTARPEHAIELTRIVRRLPGLSDDEGNLDFTAYWSGHPTGA
jgi:hypothetical protein